VQDRNGAATGAINELRMSFAAGCELAPGSNHLIKPMTPYSEIQPTRRSLPDLGRAVIPDARRG